MQISVLRSVNDETCLSRQYILTYFLHYDRYSFQHNSMVQTAKKLLAFLNFLTVIDIHMII